MIFDDFWRFFQPLCAAFLSRFGDQGTKKHRRKSSRLSAHGEIIHGLSDDIDDDIASQATSSKMTEQHEERDQLVNPYWLEER